MYLTVELIVYFLCLGYTTSIVYFSAQHERRDTILIRLTAIYNTIINHSYYHGFTSPQVASVGLTEYQAMEKYGYCSCRTLEMKEVPKGRTINQTKGLIKMVVDSKKDNRILGVHILADLAADMIYEAVMAIKYRLTIDDIIDTVHVFPTMSEAIKLVATSFKQDVTKLSCCAE